VWSSDALRTACHRPQRIKIFFLESCRKRNRFIRLNTTSAEMLCGQSRQKNCSLLLWVPSRLWHMQHIVALLVNELTKLASNRRQVETVSCLLEWVDRSLIPWEDLCHTSTSTSGLLQSLDQHSSSLLNDVTLDVPNRVSTRVSNGAEYRLAEWKDVRDLVQHLPERVWRALAAKNMDRVTSLLMFQLEENYRAHRRAAHVCSFTTSPLTATSSHDGTENVCVSTDVCVGDEAAPEVDQHTLEAEPSGQSCTSANRETIAKPASKKHTGESASSITSVLKDMPAFDVFDNRLATCL
jgi:hypothetical protein